MPAEDYVVLSRRVGMLSDSEAADPRLCVLEKWNGLDDFEADWTEKRRPGASG